MGEAAKRALVLSLVRKATDVVLSGIDHHSLAVKVGSEFSAYRFKSNKKVRFCCSWSILQNYQVVRVGKVLNKRTSVTVSVSKESHLAEKYRHTHCL